MHEAGETRDLAQQNPRGTGRIVALREARREAAGGLRKIIEGCPAIDRKTIADLARAVDRGIEGLEKAVGQGRGAVEPACFQKVAQQANRRVAASGFSDRRRCSARSNRR